MIITGRVWKFGNDINTDLIFPHAAFRVPPEEQIKLVFSDNRPGWAKQVQAGDILVAGRNFGTGSSRPGAVLLKRLGIGCLVANSINGLFFRNCISYGFPSLQCPNVFDAFEEGDIAIIDLLAGSVTNERTGQMLYGSALSESMVDTLKAGGIDELLRDKGYLE
ncbi:3-isopropylmalate dehydratase [Dehalobacter sp. DCM]|uniref:LeuD/DmdB family oxidoreductase small subunit n=1 Tax=Dehalobacter sp. DCM TaxID=2907827 RepID=UPI003081C4DD|nr:3-isopropylmalate dehydratase [Dehalobacter sp. DCM]